MGAVLQTYRALRCLRAVRHLPSVERPEDGKPCGRVLKKGSGYPAQTWWSGQTGVARLPTAHRQRFNSSTGKDTHWKTVNSAEERQRMGSKILGMTRRRRK